MISELFPADFPNQVIIAGGFAVSPETAQDIDIFVLGMDVNTVTIINNHLSKFSGGVEFHEYAPYHDRFVLFATVKPDGSPWPIQIILTAHKTPADLLATFDLSVCAKAVSLTGELILDDTAGPLIRNVRDPKNTLKRYWKYVNRGLIEVDLDTLIELRGLANAA